MRCAVAMLLLAFAAVVASAGQGAVADPAPPQKIWVEFKDSAAYKTGREVELKTVVVRRTMKSVPKEWIEYAKVEVWMSNAELDVCALPELGDVTSLPLASDEDFVLVWEGASSAPRRGVYSETPVAQALFSDTWLEAYGKPIVLLWWQGAPVEYSIRGLLGDVSFVAQTAGGQRQRIEIKGAEGPTLVRTMPLGNWFFYHSAAKAQRHRERSFDFVAMHKLEGQARMRFSGSKARGIGGSKKLYVQGEVPITKICPQINEDKRFWLDGKIYSR